MVESVDNGLVIRRTISTNDVVNECALRQFQELGGLKAISQNTHLQPAKMVVKDSTFVNFLILFAESIVFRILLCVKPLKEQLDCIRSVNEGNTRGRLPTGVAFDIVQLDNALSGLFPWTVQRPLEVLGVLY